MSPVLRICATLAVCFVLPAPASTREHRSATVKHEFQLTHPCPSTGLTSGACPGWVKDHIVPLVCGGPDAPSNMQWQTIREAKAKDKRIAARGREELSPSLPGHHEIDLAGTALGTDQPLVRRDNQGERRASIKMRRGRSVCDGGRA
jgi:hypothetical protein